MQFQTQTPARQTRPMNQTDWSREVAASPGTGAARRPEVIRPEEGNMAPMPMPNTGTATMPTPPVTTMPTPDMQNSLPFDVIESPTTMEEARLGSLKAMLAKNLGNYVVATFLVGTQNMVSWEGVLYDVGNNYLVIYQEVRNRYIVADYYSLKFVEFYDLRNRGTGSQPSGSWQA